MSDPKRRTTWLLGAVVLILAFAGGFWLSAQHASSRDPAMVDGLLWPNPPAVPSFHLIDQRGDAFTEAQLAGRWTLVFFGFTHCPDVCPTALQAMAEAHQALLSDPSYGSRGQVVFISVDPERDSAEKLAQYVGHFSADFLGVSGGEEELKALTRAMGVLYTKVETGDSYTVDHSAGVFYISPDLHLVSVLTPPFLASDISARFIAVSRFIESKS